MTSLDSKLFSWQRLQMQCDAARARLKRAMGDPAAEPGLASLHADVQRLQGELAMVLAEISALRRQRSPSAPQDG